MFLNEFDLLDLRIAEELPHIDKLIVVESNYTHSNNSKELLLKNNSKYQNEKIEILELVDAFCSNYVLNENFQRDVAIMGKEFNDDDVIIACDLDEIINHKDINDIIEKTLELGLVKIRMPLFYYKINLMKSDNWHSSFAVSGKYLRETKLSLTDIRTIERISGMEIPYTYPSKGWHFSFLGNPKQIAYKIQSFFHAEYNLPQFVDEKLIEERIKSKTDPFERLIPGEFDKLIKVNIDNTYPETILNNLNYWEKYIEC